MTDPTELPDEVEGDEVGDISSGHGNPIEVEEPSDEKAAKMLADAPEPDSPPAGGGAGSW